MAIDRTVMHNSYATNTLDVGCCLELLRRRMEEGFANVPCHLS